MKHAYVSKIVWDSFDELLKVLDRDNVVVAEFEQSEAHQAVEFIVREQEVYEEK